MVPTWSLSTLVVSSTRRLNESLGAIEEALAENGNVIVTECLGTKAHDPRQRFPRLLAVIDPHVPDDVMQAVHRALPSAHEPFESLRPAGGIKLTSRHYAYIKIAEGCNHCCTFCIIHSLRGRLVSRPSADVLPETDALVSAGESPEIDGVVRLTNPGALPIDDWARVRITDSDSHDLTARVI